LERESEIGPEDYIFLNKEGERERVSPKNIFIEKAVASKSVSWCVKK
jgi:hypothetical protein